MITIHQFNGTHAFLSNFHRVPGGILWQSRFGGVVSAATVEHIFQAEKASSVEEYHRILYSSSPGVAKQLGRTTRLRNHWERIKVNVMTDALRAKFTDVDMRRLLLSTGYSELIEGNHWHDNVWGDCRCGGRSCVGVGKNLLGQLLMETRQWIRESA